MEGAVERKTMNIEEYYKILPQLLEKIAADGKEKYLPENTPIFMQWIVKNLELLEPNRHPLPNTKAYPYRQRLYNWAKVEPGRLICLFYVSSGLSDAQKQQMEDLEKLMPNIRIIDFNTLDLKEFDFNFEHPTLGEINISNYYKNLYSIPKDQRISFGSEIDLMRVLILLKAGEALVELEKAKPEEIPESKAAIYFDFDVQPNKEDNKIGKVKISEDILMSIPGSGARIENAIMAVSSQNNNILLSVYNVAKSTMQKNKYAEMIDGHSIYECIKARLVGFITNKYLIDDNLSTTQKYDDDSKVEIAKDILRYKSGTIEELEANSIFGFEENSESSISMKFDRSWKEESVYKSEDLPINLDPTTSLNQTVTKEITDGNKRIR